MAREELPNDKLWAALRSGVGIALVQHAYIKTNLAAGTLVAPFDVKVRGKNGYYLGWSAARPVSEALALFRDWILEEVSRPD